MVDNRPTSGYDWAHTGDDGPYWEIAKRFADTLFVTEDSSVAIIGNWSQRAFLEGDLIYGDDGNIYICLANYTATDDTTKPIAGESSSAHWAIIDGIYKTNTVFEASMTGSMYSPS